MPLDSAGLESATRTYEFAGQALLWCGIISAIAGVLTVAAAYIQSRSGGLIEEHNKWRLGKLEFRTAEAKRDLGRSQESIKSLELEAAEANRRAEEDRLARIKIEEKLAFRSISKNDLAQVAKRLAPHAPIRFDIATYPEDTEAASFIDIVEKALTSAGWTSVPTTSFLAAWGGDELIFGIQIMFRNDNAGQMQAAAKACREAFEEIGFKVEVINNDLMEDGSPLSVRVGKKPRS